MGAGRPRLYKDHETFDKATDAYFDECLASGRKPTLAGLSISLGFHDKESFSHYATYGEEFSRTVKKAQVRIEDNRWQLLLNKEQFTPGVIFDLKNNHGWVDRKELEIDASDAFADLLDARRQRAK